MKTSIFFIACLFLSVSSFAQTPSENVNNKAYYLTKSKHQKTIAWIMLGGGAALATVGIIVSEANTVDYALGNSSNDNTAGTVLTVVGAASALGSIPLFISASHNKKKAMSLSFEMERVPMLVTAKLYGSQFQPAATLHIPL